MSDRFDVLTRVGPGTPVGDLFRQFWLPVAKSSEKACNLGCLTFMP